MLLVVCSFVVSLAQQGFKITGELGGTIGGDLVLVSASPVSYTHLTLPTKA